MAIRKIDSSNLVIERTYDKKHATSGKIKFARVKIVAKSGVPKVARKELVMRKMSEIGNVIRQNEDFNLTPQDKNIIWKIIATNE